jgi:hypothetical protein
MRIILLFLGPHACRFPVAGTRPELGRPRIFQRELRGQSQEQTFADTSTFTIYGEQAASAPVTSTAEGPFDIGAGTGLRDFRHRSRFVH